MKEKTVQRRVQWVNFIMLSLITLITLTFVPLYFIHEGFNAIEWTVFGIFMICTGISITGGYHRLWAHKTYDAHFLVKAFYAFFGACALQNSVFHWASDHRNHHQFVDDNEKDPYSAKKGFFYSHIGWIVTRNDNDALSDDFNNIKDLQKDPVLQFQHKYYVYLALFSNICLPMILGVWLCDGNPWGMLLSAGFLRLFLNHHFTFFINSAAHFFGSQPYDDKDTSRDNMLLSLVTYGEGYHNYHHTFQNDYRNGIRWYHFDPTKWFVYSLSLIGMTGKLIRTSNLRIEKALADKQLKDALKQAEKRKHSEEFMAQLTEKYDQLIEELNSFIESKKEWLIAQKEATLNHLEMMDLRQQYLVHKRNYKATRLTWRRMIAA